MKWSVVPYKMEIDDTTCTEDNQEHTVAEEVALVVTSFDTNNVEEVLSENITEAVPVVFPQLFPNKALLELCKSSWSGQRDRDVQPYLRGCKWSPDGTCCLAVVNNDGVHICELPRDLYCDPPSPTRTIDVLDSVVHVKEAGLVYDFCWFPGMNSSYPETCCWITTLQNSPIQMWDAFDGSLRCSYRSFNAVDEMEAALCITFSSDATKIIGGYKKRLCTFDIDRPGRDCADHRISYPASCLAVDSVNLLAVGSWNTTINLYSSTDMGTYKSIGKMHGHSGGVTHMKFTPDGLKLVSGARNDHRLLVWDIRYYRRPLNILSRSVDTNQRIYFDISPCGRFLVTGGTDGIVKVWDSKLSNWCSSSEREDNVTFKFPLHSDCCNSVSVHPLRPVLATGSGQYHFVDPALDPALDPAVDPALDRILDPAQPTNELAPEATMKYSRHAENNLTFWWIGDCDDNDIDKL